MKPNLSVMCGPCKKCCALGLLSLFTLMNFYEMNSLEAFCCTLLQTWIRVGSSRSQELSPTDQGELIKNTPKVTLQFRTFLSGSGKETFGKLSNCQEHRAIANLSGK